MRRLLQFAAGVLIAGGFASNGRAAEMANLRNGFSIRHEHHEVVGDFTRLYTGTHAGDGYVDVPTAEIEGFEPAPADPQLTTAPLPSSADLGVLVRSASDRTQVDADFIASVIRAESANNPRARSHKGAQGLMQLMPATASKLGVKDSFDPADNVDGGARYLRELLLLYNNDMVKALAAYNAGPERVQRYGGVPPYRETHAYVARVINDYNRKKMAERRPAQAPSRARLKPSPATNQHPAAASTAAGFAAPPARKPATPSSD